MSFDSTYRLRNPSYRNVVWTALGALIFVAAAIANFVGAAQSSAIQSGVRVPAQVVGVTTTQSDTFSLLVRYRAEGRVWQSHISYKSSSRHPPSTFEVVFVPTEPSVIEVAGQPTRSSDTGWILLLIGLVFSVLLTIQGRVIWRRRRGLRPRR
jgi:hypothetical protein